MEKLLSRFVDAGLVAVVFLVPFAMGGRQALGQAILVCLAFWLGACWCLKQAFARDRSWTHSAVELLLGAALVLGLLQVAPLPPSVLERFSPRLYEILPSWAPSAPEATRLGIWGTFSFDPAATRSGLVLLASSVLVFLVAAQRIRRIEDVEWLLRWMAISTAAMAVFGLAQYASSNGKFFWVYEHPFSNTDEAVKGAFTNRNHFAHFIALGLGPLVWWILRERGHRRQVGSPETRARRWSPDPAGTSDRRSPGVCEPVPVSGQALTTVLRALVLVVCVLAGLLSLSRGGFVAICVAAIVSITVLYWARIASGKLFLGIGAIAALVIAAVALPAYEQVAKRLDDFSSLDRLDGASVRRRLWLADLHGIADFRLLGTGIGTHREVYPLYLHAENVEYTHAENGYIQVALEAGVPGLVLAVGAALLSSFWCLSLAAGSRSRRTMMAIAGIAPGMAASAVHSLFDFVWYVPGCMVMVVLLAACACRLWQLHRHEAGAPVFSHTVPRIAWLASVACLLWAATWILPPVLMAVRSERSWQRYTIGRRALKEAKLVSRRGLIAELSSVVKWAPDNSRAHARLAAEHLELFERLQSATDLPFTAAQIGDAAQASAFGSSAALNAWLVQVAGSNVFHLHEAYAHARRSIELCPLQDTSYLVLSELAFLEGPRSPQKAGYLAQALHVRPFDGLILFQAGLQSLMAGRTDEAFSHWRASFQSGPEHQKRLLEVLCRQLPASTVLEGLQPDLAALRLVLAQYKAQDRPNDVRAIWTYWAQAAEQSAADKRGPTAGQLWHEAGGAYRALRDQENCLRCLHRAVSIDPLRYEARLDLAAVLSELNQFAEAQRELVQCRQQRPDDPRARKLLERAVDQRVRTSERHSPTPSRY